jgi:hypothetical protein
VSWTPKPPAQAGFVWQQVALLDVSSPAAAEQAKKEAREKPLGKCNVCKKSIYDQMVTLDDKKHLHVDCHVCASCKTGLVGVSFFSLQDGKRLCEPCVTNKLAKLSVSSPPAPAAAAAAAPQQRSLGTCNACAANITGKVVSAGGKSYCAGCLKCLKCARQIGGQDAYFTRDNGVICENCG